MSSNHIFRRLSSYVEGFPMHHLFSPTLLDQDLVYVDKTYYAKNEKTNALIQRYLNPELYIEQLDLKSFANVTRLDLHNIGLTVFPSSVSALTQLTMLDLSSNKLKQLPDSFESLHRLKYVNVSRNQLTSLPRTLFTLTGIYHLDISHNLFTDISSKIALLINLLFLDISHTNIRYFPAAMLDLSMLTLKMEHCPQLLMNETTQRNTHNPMSLVEVCAREIMRPILSKMMDYKDNDRARRKHINKALKKLLKKKNLPGHLLMMMSAPEACAFCHGPFFDCYVKRYRIIQLQEELWVPVEYKLCSAHWNTEDERLLKMFTDLPSSSLPRPKVRRFRLIN